MRRSSGRWIDGDRIRTAGTFPWGAAAVTLLVGCLQVVQTAPPMEPEPETPDPLVSMNDPELQPTEAEGLFAVPGLAENVFYYEGDERWYRYEYRKWYQAFRWDGYWFVPEAVPEVVKAQVPEETPQTLKEQLGDLDRRLEELDRQERLRQLERQLEEIDEQEKRRSGSSSGSPAEPEASDPAGGAP